MLEVLITNGCSLTCGEELSAPGRDGWPNLLARALGLRLINLSQEGGSNARVVRTTVAALARSPELCARALVLVLWTEPDRSEYCVTDDGGGQPLALLSSEEHWRQIGPWLNRRGGPRPVRRYYASLWDEQGQRADFLLRWAMLVSHMRVLGCVDRYALGYPPTQYGSLRDGAWLGLSTDHIMGGLEPGFDDSFLGLTWHDDRGPGGHPLVRSHARWATTLETWLRSDRVIGARLPTPEPSHSENS